MPTKESGVVVEIVKAVHREYPTALLYKIHGSPYQEAGIPDLLVCVRGKYVGLEVKFQRPDETPQRARRKTTPLQRAQMRRITKAGGTAATVLSGAEALAVIRRALGE